MKQIIYTIIGLSVLVSCTDFDIEDQGYTLEPLPESISFNGEGDGINADAEGVEGDTLTVEVEAPNGTLSDITVTYELSGTATFGSDYTIAGATTTGGTMVIDHDPSDVDNIDAGEIEVVLLNDRINAEEPETIIITLVSASRDGELIEVGRGGTEYGATATVTVSDVLFRLDFSAASLSSTESLVTDTLTFSAALSFATDVDVTYDLSILAESSLAETTNYMFADGTTGSITIEAGATADTVQLVLVDNGTSTASTTGIDSLLFSITNAFVSSGDIYVGGDTTTSVSDSLDIFITDDVKEYGFTTSSTDTVTVGNVTTYNYEVVLTDTVSLSSTLAFADITIPYTTSAGDATASDFTDVTGGAITIPEGESSAFISIQVLRTGEDPAPIVTIELGDATTTDGEVLGVGDNDALNIRIQ